MCAQAETGCLKSRIISPQTPPKHTHARARTQQNPEQTGVMTDVGWHTTEHKRVAEKNHTATHKSLLHYQTEKSSITQFVEK